MLVHIVLSVPPTITGVGDYCYKLWQYWPDPQPKWHFLGLTIQTQAASQLWPEASFSNFSTSREGLLSALNELESDQVVLHYVGYAYHAKGIPVWMPEAIKLWKAEKTNRHVTVMFHELWAVSPPWRTPFWVLPTAKKIVSALEGVSDQWITSCQNYYDKVLRLGGTAAKGSVIPIASTIEPIAAIRFDKPWPLNGNGKLKIVIFGQSAPRARTLVTHQRLLQQLCQEGLVERITLMGQKPSDEKTQQATDQAISTIGFNDLWHHAYNVSEAEISATLAAHDIGLVKEAPSFLTKSTVYAALCAHGLIPICMEDGSQITQFSGNDRQESRPYLTNLDETPGQCVAALKNEERVQVTKQHVQHMATTVLSWPSIASAWHAVLTRTTR